MIFTQLLAFNDLGLLILRLAVAIIFVYHAMPKMKNSKAMSQMVGMPAGMVMMLGVMELLSGLAVATGILLQLGAFILAVVMVGATMMKISKWHVPFAAMDKTGWEFDLILLAAALALLLGGGGSISF